MRFSEERGQIKVEFNKRHWNFVEIEYVFGVAFIARTFGSISLTIDSPMKEYRPSLRLAIENYIRATHGVKCVFCRPRFFFWISVLNRLILDPFGRLFVRRTGAERIEASRREKRNAELLQQEIEFLRGPQ